eukprot:364365-Chlamydomonas_euryale.AAC.7
MLSSSTGPSPSSDSEYSKSGMLLMCAAADEVRAGSRWHSQASHAPPCASGRRRWHAPSCAGDVIQSALWVPPPRNENGSVK